MKKYINNIFWIVFTGVVLEVNSQQGEFVPGYQIKEGKIPTYLNYTFTNLPEEVFPADITIEMSLSRMPGTLLYSVDSNNNQMIVSITDGHTPSLVIEFAKESFDFSLSKLCNIEYPRFAKIKLRIQILELMYIQCNDGLMGSTKYQRTGIPNKNFPIPKLIKKTDKLQAHLWLVNTPSGDGVHANHEQLSGCIFKVIYKKQQLDMGTYQSGGQCPISCTNNVCNTGQCLETYNTLPICNCTSSFYNGPYCNESQHRGNYLTKQQFKFKAIKLVFDSSSDNIFNISNKMVSIRIFSENSNLKLLIAHNKSKCEYTISETYQNHNLHLLIIVFPKELQVELQNYLGKSKWSHIRIPIYHDLSGVRFESLRLEGNVTDISYKNDVNDLIWQTVDYNNNITYKSDVNELRLSNIAYDISPWILAILVLLLFCVLFDCIIKVISNRDKILDIFRVNKKPNIECVENGVKSTNEESNLLKESDQNVVPSADVHGVHGRIITKL